MFQSGYIVEKCEEGSNFWDKVPGVVNGTSHVAKDLEPGKKYKFRVKAENMYGIGDPVETDRSILAKNPYGKAKHNVLFGRKICDLTY
jgi:Fibronectin type III domain